VAGEGYSTYGAAVAEVEVDALTGARGDQGLRALKAWEEAAGGAPAPCCLHASPLLLLACSRRIGPSLQPRPSWTAMVPLCLLLKRATLTQRWCCAYSCEPPQAAGWQPMQLKPPLGLAPSQSHPASCCLRPCNAGDRRVLSADVLFDCGRCGARAMWG